MKTLKKDLVLNAPRGEDYHLDLIRGNYSNNNKLYLGLITNDWESFADITVNDPNISLEPKQHLIDWDFINCCFMGNITKMRRWLSEALNIDMQRDIKICWSYYSFTF